MQNGYIEEISVIGRGRLGLLIAAAMVNKMHPKKMFLFMPAAGPGTSTEHIHPHDG